MRVEKHAFEALQRFQISKKLTKSAGVALYLSHTGPPCALEYCAIVEPKTKLMMAVSFITMFNAGPEVSFRGSPTVSPVTAFLCAAEPLR